VCSHSLLGFTVDDSAGLAEVTVDAGDAYACSVIGELEASAADDVVFADDGALARGVDVYDDVALGGETRVQGTPIFNGYRALIPQLGVYTSPDPLHWATIRENLGAGAYGYAGNEPFVAEDPDGRFTGGMLVGVGGLVVIGAAAIVVLAVRPIPPGAIDSPFDGPSTPSDCSWEPPKTPCAIQLASDLRQCKKDWPRGRANVFKAGCIIAAYAKNAFCKDPPMPPIN
jgi:RHS repeat-associated protein